MQSFGALNNGRQRGMPLIRLTRWLALAGALIGLSACTAVSPVTPLAPVAASQPKTESLSVAPAAAVAVQQRPSRLYELARPADATPPDLPNSPQAPLADRFSLESTPDAVPGSGVFLEFERGGASWYGPGLHGRRTASGERYDMHALTAAHRTLPFGTIVRVRSLVNGREVEVRITDRGPFVHSRVIDVSRAAAVELDMLGLGFKEVVLLVSAAIPERPLTAAPVSKRGRKARRHAPSARRR